MRSLATVLVLLLLALPVWAAPPDDDIEVAGLIEALTDDTITVGGTTFVVTDETEIEDADGDEIPFSDLQLGWFVEVEGELDGGLLVADEIEVQEGGGEVEVEGVITDLGADTVTVGGLAFLVTGDTEIEVGDDAATFGDLQIGQFAEVEGHYDVAGTLIADEIEVDDEGENEIEVEGFIDALTASSLTVQGLTFEVTGATRIRDENENPIPFSDLALGDEVEVEGHYDTAGLLVADEIELEDEEDGEVEITGTIESLAPDEIVVAGVAFAVTNETRVEDDDDNPIPYSALLVGMVVEVHGREVAGVLEATRIEVEDEMEDEEVRAQATIDAVSDDAVVLLGRAFLVTAATRILDVGDVPTTLDALAPGDVVEVEADLLADGSLVAREIEREDDPVDRVELRAALQSVGSASLTLLGVSFAADAATVITDGDGDAIALADLPLGARTEVTAVREAGGTLRATRIETRRRVNATGTLTGVGNGSLALPGLTARLTASTLVLGPDGAPMAASGLAVGQAVRVTGTASAAGVEATRVVVSAGVTVGTAPAPVSGVAWAEVAANPSARPVLTLLVEADEEVTVTVVDALGRTVTRLHGGRLAPGPHRFAVEGVAPGLYLVRASTPEGATARAVTVVE